jgi:hypothetical protein
MGNKLYNDFIDFLCDSGFNPSHGDYTKSALRRFCKEKKIMSPEKFDTMFRSWMFKI